MSHYRGAVTRLLPDLDPLGRMARLLIAVEDPLQLLLPEEERAAIPLLLGSYVEVSISGRTLASVVQIPTRALRNGNQVLVMNAENRMEVREVVVAWRMDDEALISSGLEPGLELITSRVAAPVGYASPKLQSEYTRRRSRRARGVSMSKDSLEPEEKRGVLAWMAQNAVAANILMFVLIASGLAMLASQIRQEVFPEVELDLILVNVVYPGASPEEVEQGVILAVEESVRGLDGVKEMRSTAAEGVGVVAVELMLGTNANRALADGKCGRPHHLFPEDIERPVVSSSPQDEKQSQSCCMDPTRGDSPRVSGAKSP